MSVAEMLARLQEPLVTVLGTAIGWTEVLGFGSGALCVWLVARRRLANGPVGIANNVFYLLLFAQTGLYADAGLQVVFTVLAAYGWWIWTHGGGPEPEALPVRRAMRAEGALLIAAGAVGTAVPAVLLDRLTDSAVPFRDALGALTRRHLRPVPHARRIVVAADRRGPRVRTALRVQGAAPDLAAVRRLRRTVRRRAERVAPGPGRRPPGAGRGDGRVTAAPHVRPAGAAPRPACPHLVPGKFCPPHAGHHHLVRTARARCERLTVLVCASPVESVPLADRVAWMREEHPDATVVGAVDDVPTDLGDPDIRDAHLAVFRAAVPEPVHAVFSSEVYGAGPARGLGAVKELVDPDRTAFPVSGTAVRRDPVRCREFLAPQVRAAPARRVVVVGAESTGTTTLARDLAAHYRRRGGVWNRTGCVAEYGREFCEHRLAALRASRPSARWSEVAFTTDDFPLIERRQKEAGDAAARAGSPLLVCDTDSFATTVWHERCLGHRNPAVEEIADRVAHHLWLLTDHRDVPFEDDGLRDGEHLRPWMTERFRAELARTERTFVRLSRSREARLTAAAAALDELPADGWDFAPPLPQGR
jgi:HTH-type transcriptional repressor of NAD biosynthesis genes